MCRKIDNTHPNYADLAGYWRMDEGSGTTTADLSINGNNGTLVNSPTWINSSVPLGDFSVNSYNSSDIVLDYQNLDSLKISNITGSPTAIHLYRIDEAPNHHTISIQNTFIDTSHYWGIFVVDGAATPSFSATYYFEGNPYSNNCGLDLFGRADNSVLSWTALNSTQNIAPKTLTKTLSSNKEMLFSWGYFASVQCMDTIFCAGDSAFMAANSSSSYSYQWLKNNTAISGETSAFFWAKTAGTYSVILTSANCSDTSKTYNLSTLPQPATPVITQTGDSLMSNSLSGNQWYNANGKIIGATSQYYKPIITGIHYVVVSVAGGCNSDPSNEIDFGASLSPEYFDRTFIVYPNPAKNNLFISAADEIKNVRIFNSIGQLVYSENVNSKNKELIISSFDSGIYHVQIETKDYIISKKISIIN